MFSRKLLKAHQVLAHTNICMSWAQALNINHKLNKSLERQQLSCQLTYEQQQQQSQQQCSWKKKEKFAATPSDAARRAATTEEPGTVSRRRRHHCLRLPNKQQQQQAAGARTRMRARTRIWHCKQWELCNSAAWTANLQVKSERCHCLDRQAGQLSKAAAAAVELNLWTWLCNICWVALLRSTLSLSWQGCCYGRTDVCLCC